MTGTEAAPGIAVEVLVEEQSVVPRAIGSIERMVGHRWSAAAVASVLVKEVDEPLAKDCLLYTSDAADE